MSINMFYRFFIFLFILFFCLKIFCEDFLLSKTLQSIANEDKYYLEEFLRTMLESSEVGYVLYGDKPICFEFFPISSHDPVGKNNHHFSSLIINGIQVWQRIQLPTESKKYVLHIQKAKNTEKEWARILFINKSIFHDVVNKNILLFKYLLGPSITSQILLDKLTLPSADFFEILKHDKVLVGILLGFGVENALYVSRQEQLDEFLFLPESPPFAVPKMRKEMKVPFRDASKYFDILLSLKREDSYGSRLETN